MLFVKNRVVIICSHFGSSHTLFFWWWFKATYQVAVREELVRTRGDLAAGSQLRVP